MAGHVELNRGYFLLSQLNKIGKNFIKLSFIFLESDSILSLVETEF